MLWTGTELLLLFIFPLNSVQNSELPAVMDSDMLTEFAYQPGPSYLSLILLVLTVGLSGSVYLCVLRYICTGCCQPVVVGPEDDAPWGRDQLPRATAGSSYHGNNGICLPLDGAVTSAVQIA